MAAMLLLTLACAPGPLDSASPFFERSTSSDTGEPLNPDGSTPFLLETTASWVVDGANSSENFGSALSGMGDLNGDGYQDLAIAADEYSSGDGRVYVYFGSASGLGTAATTRSSGSDESYGSGLTIQGDFNGDGYHELAVGAENYSNKDGRVYIYNGSSTGIASAASTTISYLSSEERFGCYLSAGDFDGDGYDDLAVGADRRAGTGYSYLYYGSSTGLSTSPDLTLAAPSSSNKRFGDALNSAGDINGDGYDDLIVGDEQYNSNAGRAYLYLGSSAGLSSSPTTISAPTGATYFGGTVRGIGDVNGDGYADIAIGARYTSTYTGSAYVYLGSATGINTSPATSLSGTGNYQYYGTGIAGGDIDGDGYSELLVSAVYANTARGQVYQYSGSSAGTATTASATLGSSSYTYYYAGFGAVLEVFDPEGDGYMDVVVATPGYSSDKGRVEIFTGYADADADGYSSIVDCDDHDAAIHPGATEICDDVDNDCDGLVDTADPGLDTSTFRNFYPDSDGDGYGAAGVALLSCSQPAGYSESDKDCDDSNAAINPIATEVCDGADNDCDSLIDAADPSLDTSSYLTWYLDVDGDGFGGSITTEACDQPRGYIATGGDCDEGNTAINPAASEVCDGLDNDCNGLMDDEDAGVDVSTGNTFYWDSDGDGYGDPNSPGLACELPPGYATNSLDCSDSDAAINPDAQEVCDGVDNDCDGLTDDNDSSLDTSKASYWYYDSDSDGYGNPLLPTLACAQPSFYVADDGDCDDLDASINPGAPEICDGLDNNCDSLIDDADPLIDVSTGTTWYLDSDGDGVGGTASLNACSQPAGYVAGSGDCSDLDAAIYPGATELCDGFDNDCDSLVDDADPGVDLSSGSLFYADSDGDGYGDPGQSTSACAASTGWVADFNDCNDTRADISPGSQEICDTLDNDCDSLIDDADSSVDNSTGTEFYQDSDGDGFGDASIWACALPGGASLYNGDCNDSSNQYYPGAPESCTDTEDYNCDGVTGDIDTDGDGYSACEECNDGDAAINPAALEICDGADNDCDGLLDDDDSSLDSSSASSWYADNDHDGYGDPGNEKPACNQPADYVTDSSDCDDNNAQISPSAQERCDGIDNDCDGLVDDEDPSLTSSTSWYMDEDGDGWGGELVYACSQPTNSVLYGGDCNDADSSYHPSAPEDCSENIDYNCDGASGDIDGDGDGFKACEDCNDGSAAIFPGGLEVCDGIDNDCDALVDASDDTLSSDAHWFEDTDGDGFGGLEVLACEQPEGTVELGGDCEDGDPAINPDAVEVCDGIDNDCDGAIDPDLTTWYQDADGDGFGDSDSTLNACEQPDGFVEEVGDCDDSELTVYPGAEEICDGLDNDCDGSMDTLCEATSWYAGGMCASSPQSSSLLVLAIGGLALIRRRAV